MFFRIIFLVLACILLSAHFLRSGNLGLMAICFFMPFLLLIKKRWSLITLQVSLYIGTWIWVRTAIIIIHERIMLGISWSKSVIIIGLVAFFTLLAGLLLNAPIMRERYASNITKKDQDKI
jgi:hypothetical protein